MDVAEHIHDPGAFDPNTGRLAGGENRLNRNAVGRIERLQGKRGGGAGGKYKRDDKALAQTVIVWGSH
jgi:hypothetical protein